MTGDRSSAQLPVQHRISRLVLYRYVLGHMWAISGVYILLDAASFLKVWELKSWKHFHLLVKLLHFGPMKFITFLAARLVAATILNVVLALLIYKCLYVDIHTLCISMFQLAPYRNDPSVTSGFPDIRWHQTADTGYVPNPRLQNVFMSVAMDLPDYKSPYGR